MNLRKNVEMLKIVEAKKTFLGSLKVLGLICIFSLMYAGFAQVEGGYSISQIQHDPLNLSVPVMRQSKSTSCGEAVIAMTYNYAYPNPPITEQEVIDYATAHGYYTEDLAPFTSPLNMVKIAENYVDDVSTGTAISSGQGLAVLIQNLRNGEPIIIDVLSNFNDPQSEAHFIVITGISVDQNRDSTIIIHYNDPLTGTKELSNWASSKGVWNAWQNNGDPGGAGWWMVIPPQK